MYCLHHSVWVLYNNSVCMKLFPHLSSLPYRLCYLRSSNLKLQEHSTLGLLQVDCVASLLWKTREELIICRYLRTGQLNNIFFSCLFFSLPMASCVVFASGFVFSKALHKEAHSKHLALRVGTNGCSPGNSMVIFFPLRRNSVSGRSMGDRLCDNPSFWLCSSMIHGFSSLSTLIPALPSLADTALERYRF